MDLQRIKPLDQGYDLTTWAYSYLNCGNLLCLDSSFGGKKFHSVLKLFIIIISQIFEQPTPNIKMQDTRHIQIISELIKRIKASSGEEKMALIQEISKQFQIDANEKWLVSRLRMMLLHLRAPMDSLVITETKKCKEGTKKPKGRRSLNKAVKKSKDEKPKERKTKRVSLEEKQLQKLRSLKFQESKSPKLSASKVEFYKAHGLLPLVIQLDWNFSTLK